MKAPDQNDVPVLIRWLRKPDPLARLYAASMLGKLGSGAERAVPDLADLLKEEEDVDVAVMAVRTLGQIGVGCVPALVHAMAHPTRKVRREAIWAIRQFGPQAHEAVPALMEALDDVDTRVRMAAAHTLGKIGPAAEPAIPALVRVLEHTNLIICRLAAEALAHIGSASLPALTDLMLSPDHHVRREAAWAIRQLVPDLGAPEETRADRVPSLDDETFVPVSTPPEGGTSHQPTVPMPIVPLRVKAG